MKIDSVRWLRGPNIWGAGTVLEALLDLGEIAAWSAERLAELLSRFLPDEFKPSRPSDAAPEPWLGRAFGDAVLKLQNLAGTPVSRLWVASASRRGTVRVAVEFAEELVGRTALEIAWQRLLASQEGPATVTTEDVRRLREAEYETRLPISTAVIYHAARARGIPVARLNSEYFRYLRLGQGSKQHRTASSEPDTISAFAETISTDKYLAKQLMRSLGIPVPFGRLVAEAEEAWTAACAIGLPVAIKPQDKDKQTGVFLDLRTREQVESAFHSAKEHSAYVLVESFAPGVEHRVLVAGERISAVTRIDPPQVVGDGVSTIRQLVEQFNRDPLRGPTDSESVRYVVYLDDIADGVLAAQDYAADSVPLAGIRVLLRRNPPYFRNGGNLIDLTDRIHPSIAAHAIAAAQALQLPVAGVDVVALDITRPLEEQGGVIVEINAGPGIWLHLAPWAESPRPVGADIVASLFPPGADGRIPVIALVADGPVAATIPVHLTARLALAGLRLGSASATELAFGGRRWPASAGTPQERATVLLQHPAVDIAMLDTTASELVDEGFGNDRCDVAVVAGTGKALAGAWRIVRGGEDLPDCGDFLRVLRHALAPDGGFVLPGLPDDSPSACVRAEGGNVLLERPGAPPVILSQIPKGLPEHEIEGLLAAFAVTVAMEGRQGT